MECKIFASFSFQFKSCFPLRLCSKSISARRIKIECLYISRGVDSSTRQKELRKIILRLFAHPPSIKCSQLCPQPSVQSAQQRDCIASVTQVAYTDIYSSYIFFFCSLVLLFFLKYLFLLLILLLTRVIASSRSYFPAWKNTEIL